MPLQFEGVLQELGVMDQAQPSHVYVLYWGVEVPQVPLGTELQHKVHQSEVFVLQLEAELQEAQAADQVQSLQVYVFRAGGGVRPQVPLGVELQHNNDKWGEFAVQSERVVQEAQLGDHIPLSHEYIDGAVPHQGVADQL